MLMMVGRIENGPRSYYQLKNKLLVSKVNFYKNWSVLMSRHVICRQGREKQTNGVVDIFAKR